MIHFKDIYRTGKYKDIKLTSGCQRREWVGWGGGGWQLLMVQGFFLR